MNAVRGRLINLLNVLALANRPVGIVIVTLSRRPTAVALGRTGGACQWVFRRPRLLCI